MNYIAQLKGFRIKRLTNPISANSICLYFILLEYVNELSFLEWFTAPNSTLQGLTGLSISALQRARNELVQRGYIQYKNGQGNTAGRYHIEDLTLCFEQQMHNKVNNKCSTNAQQSEQHLGSKVNTLIKLNETNLNENNTPYNPPKRKFADFVSMTNEEYSSLVTKLGEYGAKQCIEILDNYKGANGKRYKSDYRAILNWVISRYEEEQNKKGVMSKKVTTMTEEDFAALDREWEARQKSEVGSGETKRFADIMGVINCGLSNNGNPNA